MKMKTKMMRNGKMGVRIRYLGGTLIFVLVGVLWAQEEGITFIRRYEEGVAKAVKERKPLMLYFSQLRSSACQKLEEEALASPMVIKLAKKFVPVELNVELDKYRVLLTKYGVSFVPTIVFIDINGKKLAKFDGAEDAEFVWSIMNEVITKYKHPSRLDLNWGELTEVEDRAEFDRKPMIMLFSSRDKSSEDLEDMLSDPELAAVYIQIGLTRIDLETQKELAKRFGIESPSILVWGKEGPLLKVTQKIPAADLRAKIQEAISKWEQSRGKVLPKKLEWLVSYKNAMERSVQQKKPIFLLISTLHSRASLTLKEVMQENPSIREISSKFVLLEIDALDKQYKEAQQLRKKYNVQQVPAVFLIDSAGRQFNSFLGVQEPYQIWKLMKDTLRRYKPVQRITILWAGSYKSACFTAGTYDCPLVLFFSQDTQESKQMEEALTHPSMLDLVGKFSFFKTSFNKDSDEAKKYEIESAPTLVICDKSGEKILGSISGKVTVEDLKEKLERILADYKKD
jgi:thioredoxin-like negative regulator of GroEL